MGQRQAQPLWRQFALAGLVILLVVYSVWLLVLLQHILAVLFLGGVVGIALSPLADGLARYHVPRVLSILLVYGLALAALGGFGFYTANSVSSELQHVSDLESQYQHVAQRLHLPPISQLKSYLQSHASGLSGGVASGAFRVFTVLIDFVTIFVVGVLFAVTKERMKGVILSLVTPSQRHEVSETLDVLGHRVRFIVLGLFVAMLAVGTLLYIGLLFLGVPFPLVLAAIAFLTELLPYIGPWLGYIPALLVSLTLGWVKVIEVSALYLAVQEIEAHVLVPLVHSRVNQVPALLIIVAVLVGGSLMGILGALIGLPLAVIGYTLFFELFVPWRQRQFGQEGAS